MIPLDDRGLLLGDGLFETLLAVDGALVDPQPHLERMAAGCAALGLPPLDRAAAQAAMAQALAGLDAPRAAVRLTLTAGSGGRGLDRPQAPAVRLFASAAPAPAPQVVEKNFALNSDVLFAFGKSTLKAEGLDVLNARYQ